MNEFFLLHRFDQQMFCSKDQVKDFMMRSSKHLLLQKTHQLLTPCTHLKILVPFIRLVQHPSLYKLKESIILVVAYNVNETRSEKLPGIVLRLNKQRTTSHSHAYVPSSPPRFVSLELFVNGVKTRRSTK